MILSGENQGFALWAYFEKNKYVIAKQRAFWQRFINLHNTALLDANTI